MVKYTHGHHPSVLAAHASRAARSATSPSASRESAARSGKRASPSGPGDGRMKCLRDSACRLSSITSLTASGAIDCTAGR